MRIDDPSYRVLCIVSIALLGGLSPLGAILATLGVDSGWAYGALHDLKPVKWGPPIGDIEVYLGWWNSTTVLSTPYGKGEIDVEGDAGRSLGAACIIWVWVSAAGGLILAWHLTSWASLVRIPTLLPPEHILASRPVLTFATTIAGIVVCAFSSLLYLGLAKGCHDQVKKKLTDLSVQDNVDMWPVPSYSFLGALTSGGALIVAAQVLGRIPDADMERYYGGYGQVPGGGG